MANCENCGKENAKYINMTWTVKTGTFSPPKAFCNYKCARGDKPETEKPEGEAN